MKLTDVTEPARIAQLAHDGRGYPIPVAVPRMGGQPQFASISSVRKLLLGHWDLCAVCGLRFTDAELRWLPGDADDLAMRELHLTVVRMGTTVRTGLGARIQRSSTSVSPRHGLGPRLAGGQWEVRRNVAMRSRSPGVRPRSAPVTSNSAGAGALFLYVRFAGVGDG